MAKAVGLIGNFIGKVGNMVGYRVKDSNNKQTQGIRVYQPTVSNPKTYGQCVTRAKMKPINNFYRALKDIIDRGFEGKAYGNPSRLEFLRLAMSNFEGPWVLKGTTALVPGSFTIANGSLPQVFGTIRSDKFASSLRLSANGAITTISDLSTQLLANNNWLQEGDQITLVVWKGDDLTNVGNLKTDSIILDTTNNENQSIFDVVTIDSLRYLADTGYGLHICGAWIISREGSNGAHLRSKAVMTVADSILNAYMTDEAMAAAVASYMDDASATDWPEEAVDMPDYAKTVITTVKADMTSVADAVGVRCLGYKSVSGETGVFYKVVGSDKQLVKINGDLLTVTVEGTATAVMLSNTYTGLAMEYKDIYAFGA